MNLSPWMPLWRLPSSPTCRFCPDFRIHPNHHQGKMRINPNFNHFSKFNEIKNIHRPSWLVFKRTSTILLPLISIPTHSTHHAWPGGALISILSISSNGKNNPHPLRKCWPKSPPTVPRNPGPSLNYSSLIHQQQHQPRTSTSANMI